MVVVVEVKVTVVVVVVMEVVDVTIVDVEAVSTTIGECVIVMTAKNPDPSMMSDYTFTINRLSLIKVSTKV